MLNLLTLVRTAKGALPRAMNLKTRIVIEVMRTNLHRKVSLAELADSAGISTSHLVHLFKADVGMPPGQYLMKLRMEKACEMLSVCVLSIKEVMAAVGFNDKSDFARSFRRAHGLSPSEYREKNFDPSLARSKARLTNK